MKKIILLLTLPIFLSCKESHIYEVKVFYCDNRNPENILVESKWYPNTSQISTFQEAVPKYYDKLNVCDIEVIKIVK